MHGVCEDRGLFPEYVPVFIMRFFQVTNFVL